MTIDGTYPIFIVLWFAAHGRVVPIRIFFWGQNLQCNSSNDNMAKFELQSYDTIKLK